MGVGTLALVGMLWAPGQGQSFAPNDSTGIKVDAFFNQTKLEIPIKYDVSKKREIRELELYCSEDMGRQWNRVGVAKPDVDSTFAFVAQHDGLYWFNMAIVDHQGVRNPPAFTAPAFRVIIDTKGPDVRITRFERSGDDALVQWEVQEPSPDWKRFQVDYKIDGGSWIAVTDAKGAFSGMTKFRIPPTGMATVRILAYDLANNKTEMTRDLPEQNKVIGVSATNVQQTSMRAAAPLNPPVVVPDNSGVPILPPDPITTRQEAPIIRPEAPIVKHETPNTRQEMPITRQEKPLVQEPAVRNEAPAVRNDTPIGSPLAVSPTTPRAHRGGSLPSAQVINVARFDVAYDVEQKGPSGLSRAEVWVTRDDGNTWNKWSTTEKTESPVTVDLGAKNNAQVEGLYGIKIVLLSGAGLSNGPPVNGDAPEMRVDVDLTPPVVKIYEPIPDPTQKDTMIIRWQAVDRNLAQDPITLEWAEQADGPWNSIAGETGGTPAISSNANTAKRLANSGQYAWKLPSNFPTHRVYIRVTARDTAGNIAEVRSPHPILVDMNKPVAKIHGIVGASPAEQR